MSELKHTIEGIYRKAQKLLEQKQALEHTIDKMQQETGNLQVELKEKDKMITALNEEIKTIKMVKQFAGGAGNEEFSGKINDMIKELDGVIGKLKNEKD